ncbi:hypothetical protein NFI96_034174 [Prochilodus magdalenae]|nr:hypothetical protein NFI96_034174 [Prochilodus magdalenae]
METDWCFPLFDYSRGQAVDGALLGSEDNSTAQPHIHFNFSTNGTFLKDEAKHNLTFEDQVLQLTLTVSSESFQNQWSLYPYRRCNETLLMMFAEICWNLTFNISMTALGEENWCDWDKVIGHYNDLTLCLEMSSSISSCFFPGPVTQNLFVDIHKYYFSSCSSDNKDYPNTPLSVVLTLTLLPVSIIPIAVYMVITKNNLKD